VEEHQRRTGSALATTMLADWGRWMATFRQLVPVSVVQPAASPQPLEEAPKTTAQP